LQESSLAAELCFDCHRSADCVTITFAPTQAESDRRRKILSSILQEPQLRTVAVLQQYFLPAIMIEIG
jgi:hypothetical protein